MVTEIRTVGVFGGTAIVEGVREALCGVMETFLLLAWVVVMRALSCTLSI